MQTMLTICIIILSMFGLRAEGDIGVQLNDAGDGKIIAYTSGEEVDDYYNYISYKYLPSSTGDIIYTLYIFGSDEPDDIIYRYDFWEKGE